MSTLCGRDKRAQRCAVVAAKHQALEPEREAWEAAPEWWRELETYYTEPTGEDLSYLDARRMYG